MSKRFCRPRPIKRKERQGRDVASLAARVETAEQLEMLLEGAGPETRLAMIEVLLPNLRPELRFLAQCMISEPLSPRGYAECLSA